MSESDVVRMTTPALEAGDHETLARLIERHWGRLLRSDVPLLGRAVATMPGRVTDRHPALTLIGEILQRLTPGARSRGDDALQRVVATVDTVTDPAARVGIGLSAQIAMRRRGMFDAARSFGVSRIEMFSTTSPRFAGSRETPLTMVGVSGRSSLLQVWVLWGWGHSNVPSPPNRQATNGI